LPTFDDVHKKSLSFQRLLTRCVNDLNEPNAKPALPNVRDIAAHVKSLKKGKAADIFGITSEHIKYASPLLMSVLTTLAQRIFTSGCIPDDMKVGLVTPVPKKGKPPKMPDSYRRITVSSIIGKVIEKEIVKRTKLVLDETQSPLQFGFTEKVSCNNAAALITEAIAENKTHSTTYITFMDASKCFDVVDHDAIMGHLYADGVRGQLWSLYDSMYSNITSVVKWQGQTSKPLEEGQGIRQGGLSSTDLFKNRATPLLRRLEQHPAALRIGSIRVGAVMVADDLALMATTPMGMQSLIKEAELDASRERYSFSETKTKCVTIKPKKKSHKEDELMVYLNNATLENTAEETHIGICRQTSTSNSSTVSARIRTARRTCYALMGAGLHGLNGINPKLSKKIWATYIFPRLSHGLECLCLNPTELSSMESFYRNNLRAIQHFPQATANAAVYLLLGVLPFEAQLHIKTLTFYANMLRRPDSIEAAVIHRQISMKAPDANTWVTSVQTLLTRYDLPTSYQLTEDLPSKLSWKLKVRHAVRTQWSDRLKEEARRKTTLSYLNIDGCSLHMVHPVWDTGATDPLTVTKTANKAKMLVQRYPVYSSRTAGKNYGHDCPLCGNGEESMAHFLLHCPKLETVRQPYVTTLARISSQHYIDISLMDDTTLCKLILDTSDTPYPDSEEAAIGTLTRDWCFKLHHSRSVLLGAVVKYTRRRGNAKSAKSKFSFPAVGPTNPQ
jgi:hypothetical protein